MLVVDEVEEVEAQYFQDLDYEKRDCVGDYVLEVL